MKYLTDCGHDSAHVNRAFEVVGAMTREEARTSRRKVRRDSCVFVTKFNCRAPDIRKIFRKHRSVLDSDEQAKKILPEGAILVSYGMVAKRNGNLKELLAPSNPYKSDKHEGEGYYKCDAKRCANCKNFLNSGNSFRAAATGRIFLILKSLTCTSSNVVYLAESVLSGLQSVGSTANFKSRLTNYKSHIKHKRRTWSITNHFIDMHEANYSSL